MWTCTYEHNEIEISNVNKWQIFVVLGRTNKLKIAELKFY